MSKKRQDVVGPAFPVVDPAAINVHSGMTLLDWFAGMAMQGLLAADPSSEGNWHLKNLAEYSYQAAIEMLAARDRLNSTEPDEDPDELWAPDWILVSERLPVKNVNVLFFFNHGEDCLSVVDIGQYKGDRLSDSLIAMEIKDGNGDWSECSHWMCLGGHGQMAQNFNRHRASDAPAAWKEADLKDVESPDELFPKWYVTRDPDPDPTVFTVLKREAIRKGLQYGPQSTTQAFRWDGSCQMAVDDGRWIEVTEAEVMARITTRLVGHSTVAESKDKRTVAAAPTECDVAATPEKS